MDNTGSKPEDTLSSEAIFANIARIKAGIAEAAAEAGRDPEEITLVAASKMNDAPRIRMAFSGGVSVFGENRVQEMLEKQTLGAYEGAHLHFIGHLQKNKVKQVVGLAELIHSVDSAELMDCIAREAGRHGLIQEILLEVNIGNEASKSGFSPDRIDAAMEQAACLEGIRVRGLMAIPPICVSEAENLPYFTRMQQLFIDIREKKYDNSSMDFLSMGMSRDYRAAISCGSNMIRIGTGLFGPRQYGIKP